jgi:hypothetical protein
VSDTKMKLGRRANGDPVIAKTARDYRRRTRQLITRWRAEGLMEDGASTLMGFVADLIARKSALAPASWRQYKFSVLYCLRQVCRMLPRHAASFDPAIALLEAEDQTGCAKITDQTSSRKAKKLPDKDLAVIQEALEQSWSTYAKPLSDLLHAGRLSGLRPEEWRQAALVQGADGTGPVCLRVVNAKYSSDRAHGETRTLTWRTLPGEHLTCLRGCLAWAATAEARGRYEVEQKEMQRLLRETCRRLWPRRKRGYALYSCRHEFSAQAKRFYSPEEVAALMGHASDATGTDHYARPRRGKAEGKSAFPLPEPDPLEVTRVRRVLHKRLEKLVDLTADRTRGWTPHP